jgi:hypothetical protein
MLRSGPFLSQIFLRRNTVFQFFLQKKQQVAKVIDIGMQALKDNVINNNTMITR